MEGDYTWDEAKELCEEQGGYLAVTASQKEQSFIQELIKGKNNEGFWLGAENSGDTWTWVNGEEFEYQNWDSGEPNGDSGDMKLQIYEEDGKWDDTWNQRTQMQEYLCEGELYLFFLQFVWWKRCPKSLYLSDEQKWKRNKAAGIRK